mgnify:CR=1 FL=1
MLTTILKLAALASFVASIAVIIVYVPDPSLIAVVMKSSCVLRAL